MGRLADERRRGWGGGWIVVRVRGIRLADHRGRDATVLLVPVGETTKRLHQDLEGKPVQNTRRIRATQRNSAEGLFARYPDPDELARALIAEDPETDIEMTGRATGQCDRVHLDGDGKVLYAPSVVEVRCGSDGLEMDRRPLTVRPSNLLASPVWSGALLPRADVLRTYALTRAYQVMHSNALEFDFLYGMASFLAERNAMARVGSGRRGNGPLILERNGSKYRGFLDGRVQDDSMRLVVYLAAFELAMPEERL